MDELLALMREAAAAVGRDIGELPRERWGEDVGRGASGDRYKRVDEVAERAVLRVAEASELELNICSEEIGTIDHGAELTLIVDPIDGTTNAVRGIPFYGVSLAVAGSGLDDVRAGLVTNLASGHVYEAVKDQGATLDGRPIRVRPFSLEDAVRSPIVGGRNGHAQRLGFPAPNVRGLGAAAIELCLVAQGAMDLFAHLSNGLRIVDIAAGMLILEEAGGVAVDPDGHRPQLGFDVAVRTNLLAAGDRSLLVETGVLS